MPLSTIESSVFESAERPREPGNAYSTVFLVWDLRKERPRLSLPTLVMVEVASALRRSGGSPGPAREYARGIGRLPNVVLVALDEGPARKSAALGARHGLCGADAGFLASAVLFGAGLITLDRGQLHLALGSCRRFHQPRSWRPHGGEPFEPALRTVPSHGPILQRVFGSRRRTPFRSTGDRDSTHEAGGMP